jgi:peptidoglycan/LPS O-acetylase OafA/YrhL
MQTSNSYLPNITFIRFIAALWIVFFHFGLKVPNIDEFNLILSIVSNGFQAVTFFYVLSGFIMAYLYYNASLNNKFNFLKYWRARFARIYPAYCVALLLTFLIFLNWGFRLNYNLCISELFCLQTWFHFKDPYYNFPDWSISVEFFFYLCFPFLLKYFVKLNFRSLSIITFVFWALTQIFYNALTDSVQKTIINLPLLHLSIFIIGVYGGIIYFRYRTQIDNFSKIKLYLLFIFISSVFISFHILTETKENVGLFSPLFLLLIVMLVSDNTKFTRIFSNKISNYLGTISYSMYIFQYPIYIFSKMFADKIEVNTQSLSFLISYILILIFGSMLTHKFIEKPFRKLILTK